MTALTLTGGADEARALVATLREQAVALVDELPFLPSQLLAAYALVLTLAGRLMTPREREVASLAAGGLSNRDIAERLVISARTVEHHLEHVYRKLGVSDRGELTDHLGPPPAVGIR